MGAKVVLNYPLMPVQNFPKQLVFCTRTSSFIIPVFYHLKEHLINKINVSKGYIYIITQCCTVVQWTH